MSHRSENPLNPSSSITDAIQTLVSLKDPQEQSNSFETQLRTFLNPSERTTHRALSLLGELIDALIEPFIASEFSISQQITSLVKFAHIACALFLKHEGASTSLSSMYGPDCYISSSTYKNS